MAQSIVAETRTHETEFGLHMGCPRACAIDESTIFPLIIATAFVGGCGWVLYQVYIGFTKIRETASENMGRNNVVFTKDGLRVGVKDTSNEKYIDATQSFVVKAWNLGNAREDKELKQRR
ncbi:hypothetical protein PT974_04196 [Cladobotryum mycophilum]|uniref:Uncharacterized protein n=1 Tax=Cladobotryum mycophilum TaxID=491253 RepID=A0ABR0SUI0_9HYPO